MSTVVDKVTDLETALLSVIAVFGDTVTSG